MCTYFVMQDLARQQIFKANGLEWKDFAEDDANELLEEMLRLNQENTIFQMFGQSMQTFLHCPHIVM